jgi:NAD(P)-dependent dehydrogenase (short-subunit alcohol dehydrogenase family)
VAAVAARGPIVGLVNNAGIYEEHRSNELSQAEFERVMRTNATSVVVASREVYPHLKRAGGGLIVNIGSFFDKMGVTRSVAYCASKAAIGAITRCLAVEWAADNIRVVDVAPGYIATDLNAEFREKSRSRPGSGGAFRWPDLASRRRWRGWSAACSGPTSAFLTGETIYIDGGQGMFH